MSLIPKVFWRAYRERSHKSLKDKNKPHSFSMQCFACILLGNYAYATQYTPITLFNGKKLLLGHILVGNEIPCHKSLGYCNSSPSPYTVAYCRAFLKAKLASIKFIQIAQFTMCFSLMPCDKNWQKSCEKNWQKLDQICRWNLTPGNSKLIPELLRRLITAVNLTRQMGIALLVSLTFADIFSLHQPFIIVFAQSRFQVQRFACIFTHFDLAHLPRFPPNLFGFIVLLLPDLIGHAIDAGERMPLLVLGYTPPVDAPELVVFVRLGIRQTPAHPPANLVLFRPHFLIFEQLSPIGLSYYLGDKKTNQARVWTGLSSILTGETYADSVLWKSKRSLLKPLLYTVEALIVPCWNLDCSLLEPWLFPFETLIVYCWNLDKFENFLTSKISYNIMNKVENKRYNKNEWNCGNVWDHRNKSNYRVVGYFCEKLPALPARF